MNLIMLPIITDLPTLRIHTNQVPPNPRELFLKNLGLTHDPFATPVAETELKNPPRFFSPEIAPTEDQQNKRYSTFAAYFISPHLSSLDQNQDPLTELRAPNHAFIFGAPGTGKTTLRLTLESATRTETNDTLIVTYYLGEYVRGPLKTEHHAERLAKELAIDFFVQVIERLDSVFRSPNADQMNIFKQQFSIGGQPLRRLARRFLDQRFPNAPDGLGSHLPLVGKFPSRFIPTTQATLDLVRDCLHTKPDQLKLQAGWSMLQTGLDAARAWGYKRVFILVDGVDTSQRGTTDMLDLIQPLIGQLGDWTDQNVFGKFFLPQELDRPLQVALKNLLPKQRFQGTIMWSKQALRDLLAQRFRSANSPYISFDQFADAPLSGNLDNLILDLADGSPREMLRVISALIDAHIANTFETQTPTPYFSQTDWDTMRKTLPELNTHPVPS